MRRADRLFQIIQILRRAPRPVTAAELARELEVSARTVYRDVADLVGQRVPILGEAGLGYVLGETFDMPPLMLTPDEIEAAVLGAQWVAGRGEPVLAKAARDLIAKITAVVPERLHPFIADPSIGDAAGFHADRGRDRCRADPAWIREGRKIRIDYRDARGDPSRRVIWPVIVGFFDQARMLAGWCELRGGIPALPHRPDHGPRLPGGAARPPARRPARRWKRSLSGGRWVRTRDAGRDVKASGSRLAATRRRGRAPPGVPNAIRVAPRSPRRPPGCHALAELRPRRPGAARWIALGTPPRSSDRPVGRQCRGGVSGARRRISLKPGPLAPRGEDLRLDRHAHDLYAAALHLAFHLFGGDAPRLIVGRQLGAIRQARAQLRVALRSVPGQADAAGAVHGRLFERSR